MCCSKFPINTSYVYCFLQILAAKVMVKDDYLKAEAERHQNRASQK